MSETNINAYKAALEVATQELDRAKSRVDELTSYIESVEGVPAQDEEQVNDSETVEVKVKTPKKGKN